MHHITELQNSTKCAAMKENLSSGFPTKSDTNRALQPLKMARGLKFQIQEEGFTIYVAKTKALISSPFIAQLICAIVLA